MKRTLNTTTREQLTGLSDALRSRTISVNADGVATTNVVSYDSETMVETSVTSSPAFGTRIARGVCGLVLEEETADETIAHIYDPHGREERTDRRAHGEADFRTVAEFVYSPMGDLVERRTYTNATDYVTERFAYDHEGREVASTNALGNVVTTSYDPRGNVTAVDGATYPLRMEYDLKGRRTSLKTTRDGESWDETRWTIDPATGLCLSKTYADGSTVSYTYTPDGLPARTTWPGGRWQEDGYNAKREIVSTERSDGEETSFAYDTYSREIAVTNDSASIEFTRDERGRATNVTTTVAGTTHSLAREFDNAGRLARSGDLYYEYNSEGRLAVVSNSIAAVEYQYAADGLDAGYSLTLPSGAVFTRSVARDAMRRSLVTGITSSMNNNPVESIAYSYDALGRPTNRNNDAFGYNERGEVTSASIMGWSPSPSTASYGYDGIGNLQLSTFNAATNAYTANCLNQYTSILCDSVTLCEPTYDTDGNMLSDGILSFTYDAASRLKTVSSNGVTLVTNFYDAKSRRVKKVTSNATTTFFYDDWNLVEERIAYADNTTSTIRYYWGKDLSGTLQGAGGVGGLLWLTVDGTIYIPCYDNNGNVTRYLSVNGGALARYSYDAFGKLIAKTGRRSSLFRHRFSTKYFDSETGLYYYAYRFYHPPLMRWLNRDPIEENGGINLYVMSCNGLLLKYDLYGLVAPPIPMDEFFVDRKRRREFQISKFIDVRNYGQHVSGENYFVRVAFVARFTPPREIDNARYKQSPLSRALFGDAGVSMGGESGMYEADEKYGDIDWTKWGRPRIIEEGKSIAGVSLGRRFVYDEKKFEFGYIAYILRDGESNWSVLDKNFDMYTTWRVGGLKSLLLDRDISFRDTINKCDVVMLFFGDAGFSPQSLKIAPSQNSLKGDE